MKEQNGRLYRFILAAILSFIAILVILMLIFLPGKTTNISEARGDNETQYLNCSKRGGFDYVLLGDVKEEDVAFDIRIKYLNDGLEELNIKISKEFQDSKAAEVFANDLHANYNIYVGERGVSGKAMTPSYNYVDGVGRMTLFMENEALDRRTAPLVFLSDEAIEDESIDALQGYYKGSGFSCNIKE